MKNLSEKNCIAEIEKRGGEIDIAGNFGTETVDIWDKRKIRGRMLVLLHCSGWRQYSRRFGARPACLSYLCGNDDNGKD